MKGIMKKTILMLLMLSMVLCVNIGVASADEPTKPVWRIDNYKITENSETYTIVLNLSTVATSTQIAVTKVTKRTDDFDDGTVSDTNYNNSEGTLKITIAGLKQRTSEKSTLKFRITNSDNSFQDLELTIKELKHSSGWTLSGYSVSGNKNTTINVDVELKYSGSLSTIPSFTREIDSFDGGIFGLPDVDLSTGVCKFKISKLKYRGAGSKLSFSINTNGSTQSITLDLVEIGNSDASDKTDQDDTHTTVIPEPYGLFTRGPISDVIRANEEFDLTINIKNRGKTTMLNPVATIELSDCLMNMSGQDSFGMTNILSGSTGSITIKVKAMSAITSQAQFANVSLRFDYNNGTNIAAGNTSGKVTIPCKLSTESQSEKADSPIPNMIVTKFSYGSESVAAGSDFTFSFTFKNTSKKLDTDNIVVTVESTGFTPNGSTNTFYFSKLYSEDTKTVTLPMKANSVLNGAVEDIAINFSYEYVDKKVRHTMTSSLKVSVPVYQKDRFEISTPVAPALCYEGEEISMTMNYVNKGKSAANNVEATIEGDITSPNPTQILGNIEPGKNGQFAFALTPLMVGECNFTVTVTYEDANENIKERVFPVTLNVEAMQWEDPGVMEDPGMEEMPQEKGNLWKYIVALAALALITLLIVLRKRKKAKAIKQEANQWKAWEEEFAKEEAGPENIDTPTDKAVDEKTESSKEDK